MLQPDVSSSSTSGEIMVNKCILSLSGKPRVTLGLWSSMKVNKEFQKNNKNLNFLQKHPQVTGQTVAWRCWWTWTWHSFCIAVKPLRAGASSSPPTRSTWAAAGWWHWHVSYECTTCWKSTSQNLKLQGLLQAERKTGTFSFNLNEPWTPCSPEGHRCWR